ncbi:MAG: hypothetical protein H0W62_01840 [Chitinophagales bacterium]|nr:hypothetical protein [Chitinophagales bacterium]
MKLFSTIVILFLSVLFSKAQTKILDSSIDWPSGNLTVFLSDSLPVQSVQVLIGSQPDSSDLSNQTFTLGTNLTEADNMLVLPIGSFSHGDYYMDILVTVEGNTVDEMEYKATYSN